MEGLETGDFYSTEAMRLQEIGGDKALVDSLVAVWREAARRFPLTRACGETAYKRRISGTVTEIEATAFKTDYNPIAVNGHIQSVIDYVSHEQFEESA